MDLSIPIVGLLGLAGYLFNTQGKAPRSKKEIRQEISNNEKPSGTTIYNSIYEKQIRRKEQDIGYKRALASQDAVNTNIIPAVYNTYCKTDCANYTTFPKDIRTTNSILPDVDTVSDAEEKRRLNIFTQGPMFKPMEIQGKLLSTDKVTSGGNQPVILEGLANIGQQMSMSGLAMPDTHNNMVPYFGTAVKQNIDPS